MKYISYIQIYYMWAQMSIGGQKFLAFTGHRVIFHTHAARTPDAGRSSFQTPLALNEGTQRY